MMQQEALCEPSLAAMDITLGHGADSVFWNNGGTPDPFSEDCLITLIDLLLNHERVVFPLPTKLAATAGSAHLPQLFDLTKQIGLPLQAETDKTAQEIAL